MKNLLILGILLFCTLNVTLAQVTPGGGGPPPGGGGPVPLGGLEILLGGGALIGARYLTKKKK